eukprot:6210488-Pleurochrysis_carterae.AAC.2
MTDVAAPAPLTGDRQQARQAPAPAPAPDTSWSLRPTRTAHDLRAAGLLITWWSCLDWGSPADWYRRTKIAKVSGSDTPADLGRLFPVSNWRSIRAAEALCHSERSPGASTRRRPGSSRRLNNRSFEPAVMRVQKGFFCTTHASSWCAVAARYPRSEKHPGLAHTSLRLELKVLSEDRPAVPETLRRRAPTEHNIEACTCPCPIHPWVPPN